MEYEASHSRAGRVLYPKQLFELVSSQEQFSGRLGGEVLSATREENYTRLELRDKDPRDFTVPVLLSRIPNDVPLPTRGEMVTTTGSLQYGVQRSPLGLSVVWKGHNLENLGPSDDHRNRLANIEALRLQPGLRKIGRFDGSRLFVLTGSQSKARSDVAAALADKKFWKKATRYRRCAIKNAPGIAGALRSLQGEVSARDIVLITRGGGPWQELRKFEDPLVAVELAALSRMCATCLAVGHADDRLMLEGVVGHIFPTPTGAVTEIVKESYAEYKRVRDTHEIAPEPKEHWTPPGARYPSGPPVSRVVRQGQGSHPLSLFAVGAVMLATSSVGFEQGWLVGASAAGVSAVACLLWAIRRAGNRLSWSQRAFALALVYAGVAGPEALRQKVVTDVVTTAVNSATGDLPPSRDVSSPAKPRTNKQRRAAVVSSVAERRAFRKALRTALSPFSFSHRKSQTRAVCRHLHGSWKKSACFLPGGLSYTFKFDSGRPAEVMVRVDADSPVPLLARPPFDVLSQWVDRSPGRISFTATPSTLNVFKLRSR